MLTRYAIPALVALVLVVPASAQRKDRAGPPTAKSTSQFLALFAPVVEKPGKSVVRVQVDGKDSSLGTVVSSDGYVLTKASELAKASEDKGLRLSVKTRDGRDLDAVLTATCSTFDLAVLKVDGTGLVPIDWASTADAPVGNWVAVPTLGKEPAAVGVVSTGPQTLPPAPRDGSPRVPLEQRGFLGVQLGESGAKGATIEIVNKDSAADKAGIKPKDVIVLIDAQEIGNTKALINTLEAYKFGTKVRVVLERGGKRVEVTATLGKRPPDRGDIQNAMGSTLSDRRTGIPRFFQTDAVVKPTDCGAPLVDVDGRAIGLLIARAGRTESHAIPAETVKELLPFLLPAKPGTAWSERTAALKKAMKAAEAEKASAWILDEAKRAVAAAATEEAWWKDRPLEKGPIPRERK